MYYDRQLSRSARQYLIAYGEHDRGTIISNILQSSACFLIYYDEHHL